MERSIELEFKIRDDLLLEQQEKIASLQRQLDSANSDLSKLSYVVRKMRVVEQHLRNNFAALAAQLIESKPSSEHALDLKQLIEILADMNAAATRSSQQEKDEQQPHISMSSSSSSSSSLLSSSSSSSDGKTSMHDFESSVGDKRMMPGAGVALGLDHVKRQRCAGDDSSPNSAAMGSVNMLSIAPQWDHTFHYGGQLTQHSMPQMTSLSALRSMHVRPQEQEQREQESSAERK
jgi:hypothetical protein